MVNVNRVKWVILDSPYMHFIFVFLGGSLVETAVVKNQSYSADFWVFCIYCTACDSYVPESLQTVKESSPCRPLTLMETRLNADLET